MPDKKYDRDGQELPAKPTQHQVGADVLDEPGLRPQYRYASVDPWVAQVAGEHRQAVLAQLGVGLVRSHVLEIVECPVGAHFARVERLEHQATADLGADDLREPGGSAAARPRNHETAALVAIGVAIENPAERRHGAPADPPETPVQPWRARVLAHLDARGGQGCLPRPRKPARMPGSSPTA